MASSRHHRCCHHRLQTCRSCSCCGFGCGGGGGGCNSCCSDSTPQLTNYDDLVKTLATHHILLQTPTFQSSPPNLYSSNPYLDPHLSIHQKLPKAESFLHPHQRQQLENAEPLLLNSLLRRVADLESFLPRFSSPPHTPPPPPASSVPKRHKHPPSHQHPLPAPTAPSSPSMPTTLRGMAARTIQVAFRRFLVRRSRTLRDLKELATIEAHVAALHSAVSDKGSHEPNALSERAMHLLMRLDSIQSAEPMIRHGKRSISRDLVRMLEFIDKVLVKEHRRSLEAPELDESLIDRREFIDNLSKGTKANEKNAKVAKKKVSFSANGKSSGFSLDGVETFPEEFGDADKRGEYAHSLGREFSGNQIKDHMVSQSVHQVSDDERSSESSLMENSGIYTNGKHLKDQNGNSGLAAPLPLQMEPRRMPF